MISEKEKSRERGIRQALGFIKTSERLLKTCLKLKVFGGEEKKI